MSVMRTKCERLNHYIMIDEKFAEALSKQRDIDACRSICKWCDRDIKQIKEAPNFQYKRDALEFLMSDTLGGDFVEIFAAGAIRYLELRKREAARSLRKAQKEFAAL